jgi:two-component system CheB/CheR fusion protein
MNNLLAGTGIGTIFVDKKLCVLRFTPAVAKIVNLIKSDIGRPITHITSNLLKYESLAQDIKNVLNTLTPKEIQLQTKSGKWYLMNIQAYRTLENVVEGAVLSFVDITEMVHIKEELARLAKK